MNKHAAINTVAILKTLVLSLAIGMTPSCQVENTDWGNPGLVELEKLVRNDPQTAGEIFRSRVANTASYQVTEEEIDSLGYHLIKQNQIRPALAVFQINVELFPESWKAWDSYGEGFMYMNDEKSCREAYSRSLEVNPENRNASKMLRYLDEFLYDVARETESSPRFSPGESTGINEPYFGQPLPNVVPRLFAPGIVYTRGNLEYSEFGICEDYFTLRNSCLYGINLLACTRSSMACWRYFRPRKNRFIRCILFGIQRTW